MKSTTTVALVVALILALSAGAASAADIACPNAISNFLGAWCAGTSQKDTMHGTQNSDSIFGKGGNDTLYGNGEDDHLYADGTLVESGRVYYAGDGIWSDA